MSTKVKESLDVLRQSFKQELTKPEHEATADVIFTLAEVLIGSLVSIEHHLSIMSQKETDNANK